MLLTWGNIYNTTLIKIGMQWRSCRDMLRKPEFYITSRTETESPAINSAITNVFPNMFATSHTSHLQIHQYAILQTTNICWQTDIYYYKLLNSSSRQYECFNFNMISMNVKIYFTIVWPCIVTDSLWMKQTDALNSNFIGILLLYTFRAASLPIIGSS